MRKVVALTGVWFAEIYHDEGTEFVVASAPGAGKTPAEVDEGTADAWRRRGWAKDVEDAAAQAVVEQQPPAA